MNIVAKTLSAFSKRALHSNVPSNLVSSTFLKHFGGKGAVPGAVPYFWAFLGHWAGTKVAPGTVPLRNPKGTSRKACLENPDLSVPPIRSPMRLFRDLTRVHAKGVVLCERTCFCLLSTF